MVGGLIELLARIEKGLWWIRMRSGYWIAILIVAVFVRWAIPLWFPTIGWTELRPEGAGFAVAVPLAGKPQTASGPTVLGEADQTLWHVVTKTNGYAIGRWTFAPGTLDSASPSAIFDTMRDYLADSMGEPKSERPVDGFGSAAWDVVFENTETTREVRLILHDDELFMVVHSYIPGKSRGHRQFFNSFRFLAD